MTRGIRVSKDHTARRTEAGTQKTEAPARCGLGTWRNRPWGLQRTRGRAPGSGVASWVGGGATA